MSNVMDIISRYEVAKAAEQQAVDRRKGVAAELEKALEVPSDFFGTQSGTVGDKKVTATRNIYTKVDVDKALEIAKNIGDNDLMEVAFRVKLEVNKKGFSDLPEDIRLAFSDAITETPAKLSFKITDVKE